MTKFAKKLSVATLAMAMAMPLMAFAQNTDASSSMANTNSGAKMATKHQRQNIKTGTVSSVSGVSISMTGTDGTTYTVDASQTKIVRRYGAAMQVANIQNGDSIQVRGTVTGSSILASLIRDMSVQAKNGAFTGKVTAVSASGFTAQTGRGSQAVNTTSATVFKKNGQADSNGLADVTVGATVKFSGVWDRTNNNIAASSVNVIIRMVGINLKGSLTVVSGTALTVAGADGASYTVDASKARFVYKGRHSGDVSILQTGDQVQVVGKHVSGSTNLTASWVRDLSQTYKKPVTTSTSRQ